MNATLMVSTMDDNIVELSETFMVMITSVDSLGNVEPGSPSTSVVRIVSGIYALYYSLSLIVWNIVYLLPILHKNFCGLEYSITNTKRTFVVGIYGHDGLYDQNLLAKNNYENQTLWQLYSCLHQWHTTKTKVLAHLNTLCMVVCVVELNNEVCVRHLKRTWEWKGAVT